MRPAKSRVVTFYAEAEHIPEIIGAINRDVLPRFSGLPHFLGFVGLQGENGPRCEVIGISLWASDLSASEPASEEFRDEVHRVTGTAPSRKAYDVLRVTIYDKDGEVCVDI